MRRELPAILPLGDPVVLTELARDAEAEGWRMVSRLIAEWADGSNRFAAPSERAYVAVDGDGRAVGVGGLNVDPYTDDATVGRVRRLYVARARRRRGVASALMRQLMRDAACRFRVLHLRTESAMASAFYEAIGFGRALADPNCTHRWTVVDKRCSGIEN